MTVRDSGESETVTFSVEHTVPVANICQCWSFLDQDGTVVVYRCYRTEMEIAAVLRLTSVWLKFGEGEVFV